MKKILVLMLALALTLSLAACGGNKSGAGGADNTKSTNTPPANTAANNEAADTGTTSSDTSSGSDTLFAAQSDIMSKLGNYYLTIKLTNSDGSSALSKELYVKGEVLITMMDDSTTVNYSDFKNNKMYSLNTEDKTGKVFGSASDTGNGGMLLSIPVNFGITQSALLENDMFKPEKVGTDTVAGQKTTVYSYTYNGATLKFWLDDQYGLALKTEGGTSNWEVTELKTGNVTPTDWLNLSDYTIS
ncbi:MAG: hypothetical protein FWC60_04395 [Firmicutes bacterium]|nr:hypothetical protein [Bacillota bacterium]